VILHGWGANAQDVLGLAGFINLPDVQMVFPDAPFNHPYTPGGRMWYDFPPDFRFEGSTGFRDRRDLSTSRQQLTEFLKTLEAETGIPSAQTVLGGFSQGGAMTLDVGLDLPLAGLMILSGYLHAPLHLAAAPISPVLMVHGTQDTVVPLAAAHQARDSLKFLGANLRYHEYRMGHEIQPVVLGEIQSFVKEVLPEL
jgi:phospholipase/carboxylesterase